MEKLQQNLFNDPTLEQEEHRVAGLNLCATAIGGTVTRCITNFGGVPQDASLDTGQ